MTYCSRVKLALQVLDIAHSLVDKDKDLALYLTDWAPDNFAVDTRDKVKTLGHFWLCPAFFKSCYHSHQFPVTCCRKALQG